MNRERRESQKCGLRLFWVKVKKCICFVIIWRMEKESRDCYYIVNKRSTSKIIKGGKTYDRKNANEDTKWEW